MNTGARTSLQSSKPHPEKEKVEMQSSRRMDSKRPATSRRGSIRERKMVLQQDIDKLKKRLQHEENVHRALERAINRPLGALPRLPPYLPPDTVELLAEVAVLEEEVVWLEEQVVNFRQGLYQEAVCISSSQRNVDNSANSYDLCQIKDPVSKQSTLSLPNEAYSVPSGRHLAVSLDDKRGKENISSFNSLKNKQGSPNLKLQTVRTPVKKPPVEYRSAEKNLDSKRSQLECGVMNHESAKERNHVVSREEKSPADDTPNKISESILKCLMNIFLRMSSKKSKSMGETIPSRSALSSCDIIKSTEFKDPYNICLKFGKRDIGPYKNLFTIEAASVIPNKTTISVFLVQRLRLLLQKLASADLNGLTHHEKLAFWINIYNSCMMNAFLEHGIPVSPEMVVALMKKVILLFFCSLINKCFYPTIIIFPMLQSHN
ncbi:Hypothetical predicted protein [Olea europaea subsp. europaea]|uniref:Ternary complex factor MIP1 leucine-zipper domain-containing protein n=1 Tax=Olea europaea subsp. europaea TaxID=158383 RepID=A0A8S0RPK7_OLEEU|nr:Hypothetical predicted protein [Olea europaea subsp. europaea]